MMHLLKIALSGIIFFTLTACVTNNDNGKIGFIYAKQSWSISRLDRETYGNIEPWTEQPSEASGEILISNSCGFVAHQVEGVLLGTSHEFNNRFNESQRITFLDQMGEWCNFPSLNQKMLIRAKRWGGDWYALEYTPIHFADGEKIDSDIVVDMDFIQKNALEKSLKNIPITSPAETNSDICFEVNSCEKTDLKELRSALNISEKNGYLCYVKGVYIKDILKQANQ